MFHRGVFWAVLATLATIAATRQSEAALKTELVVSGFSKPIFAVSPPGDTNRLFVAEQSTGRIRIVDLASNSIKGTPFMIVTNLVTTGSEQGLLGLAFHPGYATNGFFYVNQIARGGPAGHTEIARYQAQGDPLTSDVGDRSTRKEILTFDQPESNHNGGWMAFGPDGYLYISSGDGGGANDNHGSPGNGQNRNTLLGKILRIDVDQGDPYSIPEGNPFKGLAGFREEIWAFGLRNPWRCSIDPLTGNLWIGDVGQGAREEIDVIPAGTPGLNFGWRPREGAIQTAAFPNETPVTAAVDPVYDYPRALGYSVTGGYVYRGTRIPELYGKYLFADYGSARFWELSPNPTNGTNGTTREITSELNPSPRAITSPASFGEDGARELYVFDYQDGQLFRIVGTAPAGVQLQAAQVENGQFQISFAAAPNQGYALESAELLQAQNSWNVLTNVPPDVARTVTVTNSVTGTQRYFRVRTL